MPHKALASIAGLPLVEHVRRRAVEADVGPVVVATPDPRIADVVRSFGGQVVLTGDHPNGTLRVAEAAEAFPADTILNVQADQPLLEPSAVRELADLVRSTGTIGTLAAPWPADVPLEDRASVKVWIGRDGFATGFSRDPLAPDARRHLGLYGFPRAALVRVTSTPVGERARAEGLEQLTWLDAGMRIAVREVARAHPPVDTPEQLARVRQLLGGLP
ncbi:MAG: NTP transferase domain-containing protein [Alphaproteobacteria bacterium]|nr:NTP transferase domain-containing protein [Alphaproteobacteria bacterium]